MEEKYHYPIVMIQGQAIGLFEMIYEKKSQVSYKVHRDEDEPIEDREKMSDNYFIRLSNMRLLLARGEESEAMEKLIEQFKINALMNYIKRVYQPMRDHKYCFMQRTNMQIFKEYN